MPKIDLRNKIERDLLLLDGAMGTELIARGVGAGRCNDYLNIESPNTIFAVHQAYIQVGSDAILTNTFGANRYALARHGLAGEVDRINTAGAKIAHKAAGNEKYVLGDIGPSGDFLEPVGNLKPDELKEAFAQQAKALIAAGVDGLIIETMTALDELTVAIDAVKSVCGDLPVFASMAFDRSGADFRTMMGVDVESAVTKMVSLGVDAVGFNCGTLSLDEYVKLAEQFVSATKALEESRAMSDSCPEQGRGKRQATIFAEPNAGKPELVNGKALYHVSPDDFAEAAREIYLAGVRIIGGCCGTSPEHIKAIADELK
jgi:methionine synthase I (cobalamin-dependent)